MSRDVNNSRSQFSVKRRKLMHILLAVYLFVCGNTDIAQGTSTSRTISQGVTATALDTMTTTNFTEFDNHTTTGSSSTTTTTTTTTMATTALTTETTTKKPSTCLPVCVAVPVVVGSVIVIVVVIVTAVIWWRRKRGRRAPEQIPPPETLDKSVYNRKASHAASQQGHVVGYNNNQTEVFGNDNGPVALGYDNPIAGHDQRFQPEEEYVNFTDARDDGHVTPSGRNGPPGKAVVIRPVSVISQMPTDDDDRPNRHDGLPPKVVGGGPRLACVGPTTHGYINAPTVSALPVRPPVAAKSGAVLDYTNASEFDSNPIVQRARQEEAKRRAAQRAPRGATDEDQYGNARDFNM